MALSEIARQNLETRIKNNRYPGRGIILGKNDLKQWVQVYWIMGRSANSRNRIFIYKDDCLTTQAADPSKVEDPSLIIYNAMRTTGQQFIVTNGSQTDVTYEYLRQGKRFASALLTQKHEPDAPNYTPRISGLIDLSADTPLIKLSVIKASPFDPDHSEHHLFRYVCIQEGFGYTVTTYAGNGDPLPSFSGEPYLLPLQGNAAAIAETYWQVLNAENKISLAVCAIDPSTKTPEVVLINKYTTATDS